VERHRLGPARIAAMGLSEGKARAAIWAGQPWHDLGWQLQWNLDGEPLGEGWEVEVPAEGGLLALRAEREDGLILEGEQSASTPPVGAAIGQWRVDLDGDYGLAQRRQAPLVDMGQPEAGESARLVLFGWEELELRWMVEEEAGTLLELNHRSADLLPERVLLKDGRVEQSEPVSPGLYHGLVLGIDGAGGNGWLWWDSAYDLDRSWCASGGRLLDMECNAGDGLYALSLEVEEGELRLEGAEAVTDLSAYSPPACAAAGQPFSLDWLAEGRCTLAEVEGQRMVIEVGP
jgi:hypothetical protein